ncbi:autotransporter outer membrane beta-barrel domain-containing protein [Devosia sp.]|uniref:autotransporter outer membrane beta-barrel domain-containing protein n=1 Tax=Devosia sp. TaxID=1871048 RepID=UPI00261CB2C6|nr:autotransporter outer membrane beta-barrel domain-containing protein [Devosia sp.]
MTISAGITGGVGGVGGAGAIAGIAGPSGAGIAGQNLAITMGAFGLVTAGVGANAITFTGGANSLTFANATTGLVGPVSITGVLSFDQSSVDTTVANAILGSGSIVKTGTAVITLTGGNTYTGTTTVNSGQLRAASANALGATTGALIVNGGTLDIDVAQSKGSLSGTGGNISLDAALTVTQSLDQTYAGSFSGAQGFIKSGAATLALSGDSSSYAGAVSVLAGRLLVNNTAGTFGTATSEISVGAGATLGGTGVIGGDVSVDDFGILAAGDGPGTLTINGDLLLNEQSVSKFQLGEPGVVGGLLNDLVDVNGQLTLDGVIDLTPTSSGYYRLFQYGTLVDNGASVTSSLGTGTLQLGVPNQVNVFVSIGGQLVQIWDGLDGVGNGTASGGDGTWDSGTANWTDGPDYNFNAAWQSQVGVFGGAPGTVVVEGTQGFQGLQFVTGGYQLNGGILNMLGDTPGGTPTMSFLNVDTGLEAGISSVISGSAPNIGLYKTGGGTLTLNGANTYSGGTLIGAGTLAISSDTNLGAIAGGVTLEGGTLRTTANITTARSVTVTGTGTLLTDATTSLTLNGTLSGAGSLDKAGLGTLIIAGAASHTGGTSISAGTLQVGNDGNSGSLTGNVANDAILAFNRTDEAIFAGAVSGAGSLVQRGLGTTVLTGANTHTGGTTITIGTLQIGNGGTSGSLAGNVANAGVLAFDRSDTLTFDGVITGAGSLTQAGTGATVLTGTNLYTGDTTIDGGGLFIDGDQSAATGLTTVNANGTLGGSGTIGGDVSVGDDATLSPGGPGAGPATLAILGDLFISGGAVLAYDFGEAYVVGGASNDLITVGGGLTLDGTLNVAVSLGGTFDPGIYRLMSYTGALTDNGLVVGTIPTPGSYVQTSIAHQVNLVNTQGMTLSYWDGSAGPQNNGVVNGGDGTWQASGNNNWTDGGGVANGPYQGAAFAIFAGAPGTVTVDNTVGAIDATGMQFATGGYQIVGGVITLTGAPSIIRVGDGTTDGTGMVATVASELTGASELVKTDLGTLVLGGANSYTGGTVIEGGTLSIAADVNLGAASGDLALEGGTLRTTANITTARSVTVIGTGTLLTDPATSLTLNGTLSGAGSLDKAGLGTLIIAGAASHTGGTSISAGTLQVGNGGTSGSLTGNVANDAILAFNRTDEAIFSGAVSGTGSLVQRGLGTTVLTGANTHTGGTTITAGTLQIGNGGTSGSLGGNVANAGILAFDRSDALNFDGVISGAGEVRQLGTGVTTLTGNSSAFSGQTRIVAGTLSVNGQLGGTLAVANGGTLMGHGTVGTTTNEAGGVIAPGNSIGTLTVDGNYIGSGGILEIEAVLGGDSSPADRLVVTGATAGATGVEVINLGGSGGPTTEGIKIIDIGGASNGTFALLGSYVFEGEQAVVAGAYGYRLYKNGISTPADGDWYLRSALLVPVVPGDPTLPLYQPGAPIYEAYADVLQSLNGLDTLRQRVGSRSWPNGVVDTGPLPDAAAAGSGIWGRIIGAHLRAAPETSTTDATYGADTWQLQAGADGVLDAGEAGVLTGGLWARYGTLSTDVASPYGDGNINATGYGLGATLTWEGSTGFYLDAQANLTWYDGDLSSRTAGTSLASGIAGFGYALGLEMGQEIALGPNWSITPQAQLTYSGLDYNDFTDAFGAAVSLLDGDSLKARLGLSADYQTAWTDDLGQASSVHAYAIANLYYEFLPGAETDLAGVTLTSQEDPLWGGIGLGGSYNWGDGMYALHGEAAVNTSLSSMGNSYDMTGTAGFNVKF